MRCKQKARRYCRRLRLNWQSSHCQYASRSWKIFCTFQRAQPICGEITRGAPLLAFEKWPFTAVAGGAVHHDWLFITIDQCWPSPRKTLGAATLGLTALEWMRERYQFVVVEKREVRTPSCFCCAFETTGAILRHEMLATRRGRPSFPPTKTLSKSTLEISPINFFDSPLAQLHSL